MGNGLVAGKLIVARLAQAVSGLILVCGGLNGTGEEADVAPAKAYDSLSSLSRGLGVNCWGSLPLSGGDGVDVRRT
jgi:hypothetical protein